jgi:hypothetical protein
VARTISGEVGSKHKPIEEGASPVMSVVASQTRRWQSLIMYVYVFWHVPKIGGQTLRDHFADQLGLNRGFVHLGRYGDEDREAKGLPPFESLLYGRFAARDVES